jgi:hypothetical protein
VPVVGRKKIFHLDHSDQAIGISQDIYAVDRIEALGPQPIADLADRLGRVGYRDMADQMSNR